MAPPIVINIPRCKAGIHADCRQLFVGCLGRIVSAPDEAVAAALETYGRCLLIEGYTQLTDRPVDDIHLVGYPTNMADTTLRKWINRIRKDGYTARQSNSFEPVLPERYRGDTRVQAFSAYINLNGHENEADRAGLANLMEDLTYEWKWQEIDGASPSLNDMRHHQRRLSRLVRQLDDGNGLSGDIAHWWHDAY